MKNKKITIKTKTVKSLADVKSFFDDLHNSGVSFHPDDSFTDSVFIGTDEEPTFTEKEAERLDKLMEECFDITNAKGKADIYEIAMTSYRNWEKRNRKAI